MPRFSNTSLGPNTQVTPFRKLEEYQENLSSQADGTNTTFSVANSIDEGLKVSINGLIYTEADGNISITAGETEFTISFAPQSDDIVVAIYSSYE
jgi:hypothetical protein